MTVLTFAVSKGEDAGIEDEVALATSHFPPDPPLPHESYAAGPQRYPGRHQVPRRRRQSHVPLFRNLPPVARRGSTPDQPITAADHRLAAPAREVPRRTLLSHQAVVTGVRHRVMRGRETRASAFVAIGPFPSRGRRLPDPHGQSGSATSGLRSGRPEAAPRRRRRVPARPAVAAAGASNGRRLLTSKRDRPEICSWSQATLLLSRISRRVRSGARP